MLATRAIFLYRPSETQPELDEVAGGDCAIVIVVEGRVVATEGQAELDEVVGGNAGITIGVAEDAEDAAGAARRHHVIVSANPVVIAIQLKAVRGHLSGKYGQ